MLQMGEYGDFSAALHAFLAAHFPALLWIQCVEEGNFLAAADCLLQQAKEETDSVDRYKTLLHLSQLSATASQPTAQETKLHSAVLEETATHITVQEYQEALREKLMNYYNDFFAVVSPIPAVKHALARLNEPLSPLSLAELYVLTADVDRVVDESSAPESHYIFAVDIVKTTYRADTEALAGMKKDLMTNVVNWLLAATPWTVIADRIQDTTSDEVFEREMADHCVVLHVLEYYLNQHLDGPSLGFFQSLLENIILVVENDIEEKERGAAKQQSLDDVYTNTILKLQHMMLIRLQDLENYANSYVPQEIELGEREASYVANSTPQVQKSSNRLFDEDTHGNGKRDEGDTGAGIGDTYSTLGDSFSVPNQSASFANPFQGGSNIFGGGKSGSGRLFNTDDMASGDSMDLE